MIKKFVVVSVLSYCSIMCHAAIVQIDNDVRTAFKAPSREPYLSLIVFFTSNKNISKFMDHFDAPDIHTEALNFMPALILTAPKDIKILNAIASFPSVRYIALNRPADEKIEINSDTKRVKKHFLYPGLNLWWANRFKGQSGIVGIIDSGIAIDHPALINKKIIVNKSQDSGFSKYHRGVRSPHGTGVACIYAGHPLEKGDNVRGVSYKVPIILSTLAGEGSAEKENYWLTYSGLNWLFSLHPLKPSVINYSFGNGIVSCPTCPDWSGMSKIVDYIVNTHKVLWVTSAGNNGYVQQKKQAPFPSSLTVPADNYNALTVANMDMYGDEQSEMRASHAIRYTSSRGPTLLGRKKPDLAAPGKDTYTCAPDPEKYKINYSRDANYENGYRLMGGTSSAAPHVGGAVLIIREAGITNPMAIKALLINSADAWTDSNQAGPDDPYNPHYAKGHHPQLGSEWNPTYGWGYINMKNAFYQKDHIIEAKLSSLHPVVEYKTHLSNTDKVTVVHERRVGFDKKGILWPLSHLKLELYDAKTHTLLAEDVSPLDTVHQVSLCHAQTCSDARPTEVIIRIQLASAIAGAHNEPFALVFSTNYPLIKMV